MSVDLTCSCAHVSVSAPASCEPVASQSLSYQAPLLPAPLAPTNAPTNASTSAPSGVQAHTPARRFTPTERDRVILDKQDMALRMAHTFRMAGKYPIEVEELQSEALLALVRAASEFDPSAAAQEFGAWAAQRIIWRLQDFIQMWYRLARVDFVSGRPQRRCVPLTPRAEGECVQRRRRRCFFDESESELRIMMAECSEQMAKLNPTQQEILRLRYEEGKTLREISTILSMTHTRCRQVHMAAMRILRGALRDREYVVPAARGHRLTLPRQPRPLEALSQAA